MGDALIGLGVLLVIIGPLLLIPVTWLLYRCVWWALIRGETNARHHQSSGGGTAVSTCGECLSRVVLAGALGI
jgi:hypothetical protein